MSWLDLNPVLNAEDLHRVLLLGIQHYVNLPGFSPTRIPMNKKFYSLRALQVVWIISRSAPQLIMTSQPDFHAKTDGRDVAATFASAVKGRVILITGVSPLGLGGATARVLAAQSPSLLVFTGRAPDKVKAVIDDLKAEYPAVSYRALQMDLSSQNSVRQAANEALAYPENIDIVINNAGVMALPERTMSEDGIEHQFATNPIGHFLFTNLIMPKLVAAAKASSPGATRVISLSSSGHTLGPVRFSDYNFEKPKEELPNEELPPFERLAALGIPAEAVYVPFVAYGQSKTANVLFSLSLTQKFSDFGIVNYGVHPGSIPTELQRNSDKEMLDKARKRAVKTSNLVEKTLDQGSSTTLVAALDPGLKNGPARDGKGVYLDNCQIGIPIPWACDPVAAMKLWTLSEELVGQKFLIEC
jgi:NAD(P)-dependent dehydrogenase (short-subunit alcohol dehydrogenase family)